MTPTAGRARRAVAPVALVLFTLIFFREIGLGGRIPLSFDPLGYFIPQLSHLGRALRELRLPLWDPYLFGGVPFLANSQTGVFYPPNWLVVLLPAARAYAWLIVVHAALGAVGSYVFARRALGIGLLGGLATALVFVFGGWPTGQAGHLNQYEAVAWLPILLLVFYFILRGPSVRLAILGGALLALEFMAGHTQTLYMSAWVLALYVVWVTLGRLLEAWGDAKSRRQVPGWLLSRALAFGGVGAVAIGLSAPQLLPTLELSGLSIRSAGLDYGLAASFSLRPFLVLQGLLPTYGEASINAEWLGYVGVVGFLLVGTAVSLRPDRRVVGMLLVALLGLGFAFGQFNPLYPFAYHHVPGIGLFRVPARWLFVYTAAMAGLVGVGLDALARPSEAYGKAAGGIGSARPLRRVLAVLLGLLAGLIALLAVYQRLAPAEYPLVIPGRETLALWALSAAAGLGLVAVSLGRPGTARRVAPVVLLSLLAVELLAGSLSLEMNRTGPDQAATGSTSEVDMLVSAAKASPGAPFRILGIGSRDYQIAGQAAIAAELSKSMSPDEVQAYLASIRDRQMETPNVPLTFDLSTIDGYDGGVLPLLSYLGLKSIFPQEGNNVIDGRLYIQLETPPDPKLLGWLNVRYLIMNRTGDLQLDGAYYDMAMPQAVTPGASLAREVSPPVEASSVGLISHLTPGSEPYGAEVGKVVVETSDGSSITFPIRAGIETGPGLPATSQATPPVVARGLNDPAVQEYSARWSLPVGTSVTRVTIQNTGQGSTLTVRALTLVGSDDASRVVDLSSAYRLAYLGDTKIYENLAVLPRAYVVGKVDVVGSDRAALDALESPTFDPHAEAIVTASAAQGADLRPRGGPSQPVRIVDYSDETVAVDADLTAPGLLVLSDVNYPGWRVIVDGVDRPIITTNYLFRGVWLVPGTHRVEFRFEPTTLKTGLVVGGAAAAICLALIFLAPRLERRRRI